MSDLRSRTPVDRPLETDEELALERAQVRREGGVRFPPRRSRAHAAARLALYVASPFALLFGVLHLVSVFGPVLWIDPTGDLLYDVARAVLGIASGVGGLYYVRREDRIDAYASSPGEAIWERAGAHVRESRGMET